MIKNNWYLPNIHFAELIKLTSEDSPRLRLRLIGQNLTHIVLRKSLFSFGFPFATNPEKVRELLDLDQGGRGRRIFLTIFTVELAILSLEYR